jgi:hypothetical protein
MKFHEHAEWQVNGSQQDLQVFHAYFLFYFILFYCTGYNFSATGDTRDSQ